MTSKSLADLRKEYYGDSEYATLLAARGAGLSAADMYSGQEVGFDEAQSTNATTSTALVDLPTDPLSLVLPVYPRPVMLHAWFPTAQNGTAGSGGKIAIVNAQDVQLNDALHSVADANAIDHLEVWARLAANTPANTYRIQMAALVSGTFTLGAIAGIRKPFFEAVLR